MKNLTKIKKERKGITLIALVVTIVVLLILAGITINLILSDNGIFGKAVVAKDKWEQAEENDQTALNSMNNKMEEILNGTGGNTTQISFTFDGVTYHAAQEITWEEYIENSEFFDYAERANGTYVIDNNGITLMLNGSAVLVSDTIEPER